MHYVLNDVHVDAENFDSAVHQFRERLNVNPNTVYISHNDGDTFFLSTVVDSDISNGAIVETPTDSVDTPPTDEDSEDTGDGTA